jgi:hypothetical protein
MATTWLVHVEDAIREKGHKDMDPKDTSHQDRDKAQRVKEHKDMLRVVAQHMDVTTATWRLDLGPELVQGRRASVIWSIRRS